ncbi:LOW QUALITY PROTEIN: dual specificity protein kinase monopolar spindle 1 [Aphomia sociella]
MGSNAESTSNSMKFAPMPMSALLANLMPLQKTDSPDSSFTSDDESDSSSSETVTKKPTQKNFNKEFRTPNVKTSKCEDIKAFASEKRSVDHNKENTRENWISNQTYPNKDGHVLPSAQKNTLPSVLSSCEVAKRSVLMPHNNNCKTILPKTQMNSAHKKTPEMIKIPSSVQKTRTGTATPKIKSGIRKFTPGSGRKSQKKTPQKVMIQNRDRVRCELFTQNPPKEEQCPPPKQEMVPVPETPMNRKPMPASYAATPSYPQGVMGNNSKVLFKTTSIKDKKYMFIKKLGTGGSSEVYKVLEVGTSCEYAVKCVYLATDQELAQGYINEVRLLRELQNSDRVIRLIDYEYDRTNQFLRMVLEVGETDLSSFLKARGAGLPPALVLHYWEEMLQAVHYIHEHGVIHADLKPANFLLVCGRLKLIDFGIASAISSDATSVVRSQATGTYSYISPEALMGGAGGYGVSAGDGSAPIKISFRSDVWSLGCILYSMVYGRTPFGHIPNLAKLAAILDPNHRIDYPPVERTPPPSLIAALKWCLTYNARARPSVRELLSIAYLQPARAPPPPLLDKLRLLVTQEFRLLQRAQL